MTVHLQVSEQMPVLSRVVFATLHDYHRRLDWDTLLQSAETVGDVPAGVGVASVCRARRSLGGLAFKTEYKAFDPGVVAAVKLVEPPFPFRAWGASIRHTDNSDGTSTCTYTMTFRCRPAWLAFAIEPIAKLAFSWETRRRLRALAAYLTPR